MKRLCINSACVLIALAGSFLEIAAGETSDLLYDPYAHPSIIREFESCKVPARYTESTIVDQLRELRRSILADYRSGQFRESRASLEQYIRLLESDGELTHSKQNAIRCSRIFQAQIDLLLGEYEIARKQIEGVLVEWQKLARREVIIATSIKAQSMFESGEHYDGILQLNESRSELQKDHEPADEYIAVDLGLRYTLNCAAWGYTNEALNFWSLVVKGNMRTGNRELDILLESRVRYIKGMYLLQAYHCESAHTELVAAIAARKKLNLANDRTLAHMLIMSQIAHMQFDPNIDQNNADDYWQGAEDLLSTFDIDCVLERALILKSKGEYSLMLKNQLEAEEFFDASSDLYAKQVPDHPNIIANNLRIRFLSDITGKKEAAAVSEEIGSIASDLPIVASHAYFSLGSRCDRKNAIPFFEKSLALTRNACGARHTINSFSTLVLAERYSTAGDAAHAKKLINDHLDDLKRNPGMAEEGDRTRKLISLAEKGLEAINEN